MLATTLFCLSDAEMTNLKLLLQILNKIINLV